MNFLEWFYSYGQVYSTYVFILEFANRDPVFSVWKLQPCVLKDREFLAIE